MIYPTPAEMHILYVFGVFFVLIVSLFAYAWISGE